MIFKLYKIVTVIIISVGVRFAFENDFSPAQNDTLNYIHVIFRWPQINSDISYTLNVSNTIDSSEWNINTSINAFVLEEYLDWGNTYEWYVCYESIYGNDCFESQYFTINHIPNYYPNQNQLKLIDESKYSSGLNIIALNEIFSTIVVDRYGEPVWFFDLESFEDGSFYAFGLLPNGNIIGNSEIPSPSGYGYEINLDGQILFQSIVNGHHHEFIKSSKNTYWGMRNDAVYEINHCEDPINEYVFWAGDKFLEYDSSGSIIWEWSTLDHLDHTDYNPMFCNGVNPIVVDWTHANSVLFDQNTNSVYISLRNISRIINIDYDTQEINWQIGQAELMNDSIDVSMDFDFSGQHSLRLLENGHILFFDNHSYLEPRNSKCIEFSFDSLSNEFRSEWEYLLPENLFSHVRGECERMENGNTVISTGYEGQLLEVSADKELVWNLELKHDDVLLNIIRNERIPSLYPLEFNVFFNNYKNPILRSINNNIELTVSNLGWISDEFFFEVYNSNGVVALGSIFVEKNSSNIVEINIDYHDVDKNFSIFVYPSLAIENVKRYNIKLENIQKDRITIYSIFPNPFNNEVEIQYFLPNRSFLTINIYNLIGQRIETYYEGSKPSGTNMFKWKNNYHPSGIYFINLFTDEFSNSGKLIYIK